MVTDEDFKKSSYSEKIYTCVEVKRTQTGISVRDSKVPENPPQIFTHEEWEAFINGVKAGEFDLD